MTFSIPDANALKRIQKKGNTSAKKLKRFMLNGTVGKV